MIERTLVLVKPDGVDRNLIGEVIRRYEAAGLKIVAMKLLKATAEIAGKQYIEDEDYLISLGKKSERAGEKVANYLEQGRKIVNWMRNYLTEGPVVAIILQGENAVARVREVNGYTDPKEAKKGTIRGDFGIDDILTANREQRAVRTIVHASGTKEEAEKEIPIWFKESEIY